MSNLKIDTLVGLGAGLLNSFQLFCVAGGENERGFVIVELIGEILSDPRGGSSDPYEFVIVTRLGSLLADVWD